MSGDESNRPDDRPPRFGQRKDPRLDGLINDWKKGEKDKWRGHGKKEGKGKKK
jgi:hypothetical protein